RYSKLYVSYLGEGSVSFHDIDYTQPMALAFGNERDGVSEELLEYSDGRFVIPQMGMIRSLNISVACAVTLYEALRQRMDKGFYDGQARLPENEHAELLKQWGRSRKAK